MDRIDLDSLLDLAPDERGAGDSTLTLSRTAWQELVYDREADSYEAQRAPVGMEMVAARHVDHLRRSIDAVGDDLHVLRARSLVTVDDGLTIAGLLLLGDHPQHYLPQALVRVLRYQADEARTGSRQTLAVDGDRRLEGAIPDVIDASLALVDSWAPRRRAMRDDGRFGPVDVIPREAWTEAGFGARRSGVSPDVDQRCRQARRRRPGRGIGRRSPRRGHDRHRDAPAIVGAARDRRCGAGHGGEPSDRAQAAQDSARGGPGGSRRPFQSGSSSDMEGSRGLSCARRRRPLTTH